MKTPGSAGFAVLKVLMMMNNPYYPQADDPTIQQVWRIMQRHRGKDNRIQRETLTFAVFHKVSKSHDRKVRDALAELPVVWDDGYFIPQTNREAQPYRIAMTSRRASIAKRLRILDDYMKHQAEPVKVEQMQLLEVS